MATNVNLIPFIISSKMAEAQILIISLLKRCMERSDKYGDRHEILVNVLLDGDGFVASPDIISLSSSDFGKSLASMRVC
jgi:hypothetical protein